MPRRFILVWTAFALLCSVQLTGCSLVGFGVGSAIDAGRPVTLRPLDRTRIFGVLPGAKLVVHRTDGTTVEGVYRGLAVEPDPRYRLRYEAWRDTANPGFRPPRVGETIRVHGHHPSSMTSGSGKATFLGFGPRRIHIQWARDSQAGFVSFERLLGITDSSGRKIELKQIESAGDRLPVQAIARIHGHDHEYQVDLLDGGVDSVLFGGPSRGFQTAGLIVGVTVDVIVVLAAVSLSSSSSSSTSCSPTQTGGSYLIAVRDPAGIPEGFIYRIPLPGEIRAWTASGNGTGSLVTR
jgi:hypothetical protein